MHNEAAWRGEQNTDPSGLTRNIVCTAVQRTQVPVAATCVAVEQGNRNEDCGRFGSAEKRKGREL